MMYLRPSDLTEALAALRARPLAVLAGGTDFYPARVGTRPQEDILDITALSTLRGVRELTDGWRIGALTTWSELLAHDLPPVFDGLRLAAREVGGCQIQNAGTLVGNVCNASPAADGIPALLALDAQVELSAVDGTRSMPLSQFLTGSRRTRRRPDELVTALFIPGWQPGARSAFRKLGARRYLVISIVMVAACMEIEGDGTVSRISIAVGSCSTVAQRLATLEAKLKGRTSTAALGDFVRPDDLTPLAPINDIRGSAEYRLDAALTLVRRVVVELAGE
jgi:CO/xanthine dehydrogenase FAD-binding subunit